MLYLRGHAPFRSLKEDISLVSGACGFSEPQKKKPFMTDLLNRVPLGQFYVFHLLDGNSWPFSLKDYEIYMTRGLF